MNKLGGYFFLFLAVFGGVLGALYVHERFFSQQRATTGLDAFLRKEPVHTPPVAGQVAFQEAASKLLPAVVSIIGYNSSFFDPSGDMQMSSMGSGVVITEDGYIVTNHHVVDQVEKVSVRLMNGRTYDANIVGKDDLSDLALLKVEAKGLPFAELGDSEALQTGEWVIAVGNPLGFEGTVSVGVVSAKNRDLPGGRYRAPLVGAIQTDAAINQGNSGGALSNIHGQVVGINTQIASTDQGSIGIGFAIPASRVKRFVSDIRKYGRARHADLGPRRFGPSQWLRSPGFERDVGANPPEEGLVIYDLQPGSPLAQAGLGRFDVIVEIDGRRMATQNDYLTFLLKAEIGQKVTVRYWQKGEYKTVTVTLTELQS